MSDSGFRMTDSVRERMAKQYSFSEKAHRAVETPQTNVYILGSDYDSGGAGLISSVSDYIKFADALACGGVAATGARILSSRSVDLLRRNCLTPAQLTEFEERWHGLVGYGYGYGVRTYLGGAGGSLSPLGQFGWQGAAGLLCHSRSRVPVLALLCDAYAAQPGKFRFPASLQRIFASLE